MRRFLVWRGLDEWRTEVASVDLAESSVAATGTQIGTEPVPYRLDYELATGFDFITETLALDVCGEGWGRQLHLRRHADGTWQCDSDGHGDPPLPPAGGDITTMAKARDCDLAGSPLTNLMPVRRHRLHEEPGQVDFLMVWVSVPDLGVHASEQRYEHVSRDGDRSLVRFRQRDPPFVAELVLDPDGIVERYPDLAERAKAG